MELIFAVMPAARISATMRSTSASAQARHILAIIDREIGLAVKLVEASAQPALRAGCARARRSFSRGWRRATPHRTRSAAQFLACGVVIEIESAVLATTAFHRPHARDMVAPAGRPPRDRDHQLAAGVQRASAS